MAERHPALHQVSPEHNVPAGKVVNVKSAAGAEDANALVQPRLTPLDVFLLRQIVLRLRTVFFVEVERRVSERGINHLILHKGKKFKTVTGEQRAMRRLKEWRVSRLYIVCQVKLSQPNGVLLALGRRRRGVVSLSE
ncbi:hypothetical protein D3C72_1461120 [compost metagenome]